MNIFRYILFLTLFSGLVSVVEAAEKPRRGIIKGKAVETTNNEPVEFANLAVFSSLDSALVSGAITGPQGTFMVDRLPYGEYYARLQFLGFEEKIIDNILITREAPEVDLGTIRMSISAIQLEGAEIVADKQAIEYKLDRKVINVSQDLAAASSTAVEVLENTPAVRVDIEGNVTLRGSSNFTVFIDGKPTVLESNDALRQIPAASIDNIEIITNPSAKYDPDGTAGIINIKLKKDRLSGFSGQADVTVATGDKYGGDLYLNYRNSKVNIFAGAEWSDRRRPSDQEEIRETYIGDTIHRRESTAENAWIRNGLNFRGGLDFYINQRSTLSLGAEGGRFGFGYDDFEKVRLTSEPSGFDPEYFLSDNVFRWKRNYYSVNATFRNQFDDEGHELIFFAFYSKRDGTQDQDKKELDTDENWNPLSAPPLLIRSTEAGPSSQLRFEADYSKPVLGNGKIETGYRLRVNMEEEDYKLEQYDHDLGRWLEDENYGKSTESVWNIHAVFGTFSHSIGSLEYQLGLRGEYTFREIRVVNNNESFIIDRFDFFPTIHLSKRFLEKNQLMASYSRRIDRPRGWYLEPFETYIDKDTRRIGNPDLQPEYTDSYELGYLRTLEKGTITADAYYRFTRNKITQLQYFDEQTQLFYNTFENLNRDQALGVELSAMLDPLQWLNLNLSGTVYHYQLKENREFAVDRSSTNWDARVMTTFKLKTTRFQLNMAYDGPTVTAQGRAEESYYMDITARQEFLKKQLSLTLRVSDIFGTRTREGITEGQGFYTYEYVQPEARVVYLTLTYRLNNFRQPQNDKLQQGQGM